MTMYTVTAERGTGTKPVWVFQCVEHPGAISQSRRLDQAETLMREAIGFVADVPEADVQIDLRVQLDDDLESLLGSAHAHRAEADALASKASAEFRSLAKQLTGQGFTVRDVGSVLGVSYQRAHQLLA